MRISDSVGRGFGLAAAVCLTVGGCARPDDGIPVGAAATALMPAPLPESAPREYRLGALDTLSVNVFQEPDLSVANVVVDAGGNVSLPLVGTLRAAGLTPAELSRAITTRLDPYLIKPQVVVAVTQAIAPKVTVDGSVEQPGVYAMQGRTTLIDAIAMARGTSRVAALDQVIVFRQINGRLAAAKFDLKSIRAGREPNPEILGNDTVVVGFNNLKGLYRDLVLSSGLVSSFTYILTR